jgi:hypothetical protein
MQEGVAKHYAPQAAALSTYVPEIYKIIKSKPKLSYEAPGAPHIN